MGGRSRQSEMNVVSVMMNQRTKVRYDIGQVRGVKDVKERV